MSTNVNMPSHSDSLAALANFGRKSAPKPPDEVTGTVDSIRMYNGWGIAFICDTTKRSMKELKISGAAVGELKEGMDYVLTGQMKHTEKFGDELVVTGWRFHVPLNEAAIVKFLEKNYDGVGKKSAEKYVRNIISDDGLEGLEQFRQQLLTAPWDIDASKINKNGSYSPEERERTTLAYIQRDLATKLYGIDGIKGNVLTALAKRLASKIPPAKPGEVAVDPVKTAWNALADDPYEAIGQVNGYGFVMADAIGRQVGIAKDAPQRLAALVAFAVREGCQMEGHVFLEIAQVRKSIAKLDSTISVNAAIDIARERKTIAIDEESGATMRVYPFSLLKAESNLAENIKRLCEPHPALVNANKQALERKIQAAAKSLGGPFKDGIDDSQVAALFNILTSRVRIHTLTAEPGSGKTAMMEILTKVLDRKSFMFCGPTGQAAKVLTGRLKNLGYEATTIHSMLQGSGAGDFQVNAANPLDGDILVVDESSMLSLDIADAIVRAMNEDMHVVFLGDHFQLKSIDPGRFIQDLMAIPQVDHNRLTTVHRNAGALLDVIREVKLGTLDTTSRPGVSFSHSLPDPETGCAEVVAKYVAAVARSGYAGTGLLMSRKKGEADVPGWNTTYLNAVLRNTCNPNARKVPGTTMFVGDRIRITDNMKLPNEETVVNGDLGTIKGFTLSEKDKTNAGAAFIVLNLDDGRELLFPGNFSSSLTHSYANTVHVSQGSQYSDVITVFTGGMPTFVNAEMLYTGLSRARTNLAVYGDDATLKQISRTPAPTRNSGLVGRVQALIDAEQDDDEEDQSERSRAPMQFA